MEPDFMRRGNVDKPFTAAPEQSLFPWIGGLFIVLALLYVSYRVLDVPSPEVTTKPAPASQSSTTQTEMPVSASRPLDRPPVVLPDPQTVTKCTIGGKTIYSDAPCPQGATAERVTTHAERNLISGLTSEQMAAADRIRPPAALPATVPQSDKPVPTNASECRALDEHIKYLDALARQPLDAQTQDWIKAKRKADRDRQFAIRC
jgi:hypothetical protein